MNNKNKKYNGTAPMIIGAVLLLFAFCIVIYNMLESSHARKVSESVIVQIEQQDENKTPETAPVQMATMLIDGNSYIGILEIPDYNITLPVMDSWSYDKLKTAPCVYSGSYLDNNLVIIGHNYRSIFNPIRYIKPNTDVYLTTADKHVLHYITDYAEILKPESVDALTEKTDRDLTLLTCTTGNQTRRTARCILVYDQTSFR